MRILIVSDVTRHMRGGVPVLTGQLIQGLVARGHEVALAGDGLVHGGEDAQHFPISLPTRGQLRHQLQTALSAFRPDFVHLIAMGSRAASRIAPLLRPYPWALTCHSAPPYERIVPYLHGNESLHYGLRSIRFAANTAAWRWLLRRTDIPQVIVHSKFVQEVVTRYGRPQGHSTLISLACSPPETVQHAPLRTAFGDGPRLVTVGGIAHTKGQHDALTALAELRRDFPRIQYQLIGEVRDRTYLAFLNARIQRLGLTEHVRVTPNLPNDEKRLALLNADAYVQPSHEEGFCLSFIEAASIVTRMVGTDTGAIGSIGTDDPCTRVVPPKQPKALAQAIRSVLNEAVPNGLMAQRVNRLADNFSLKHYLDAHESLYSGMTERVRADRSQRTSSTTTSNLAHKMRLLIVSDVTCYMRGGIPTQTGQLIQGLTARGHEVALVGDGPVPGGEAAQHFPIALPTDSDLPHQLQSAIDAFRPDCVHVMAMGSHGTHRIAHLLQPYPWVFGCHSAPPYERIVPFLHGAEPLHYGARLLRYAPNIAAWRWLLSRGVMPHVLVRSRFVQDVVTRYGYPKEQITLIPLGCTPPAPQRHAESRASSSEGPRLVTVGGVAHTKGQHDVITALTDLLREFPTIQYQIVGQVRDPSYLAFLNKRIDQLGLAGRVHITPDLPHEEKQQALLNADAYIQPSHEEGFCLAYLEAATVVPRLVGADTGAIALMSEGDPGARIVMPGKPQQIADAVRDLLRSALPPNTMSDRTARLAQNFSTTNYIDAHERLYRSLMK